MGFRWVVCLDWAGKFGVLWSDPVAFPSGFDDWSLEPLRLVRKLVRMSCLSLFRAVLSVFVRRLVRRLRFVSVSLMKSLCRNVSVRWLLWRSVSSVVFCVMLLSVSVRIECVGCGLCCGLDLKDC